MDSGASSPPSRPDSGLRKAPRKGQGAVEGHRMSPAVLAAIAEWCLQRRACSSAGSTAGGHGSLTSCGKGGRSRRVPAGPAQPAAPVLAGASARLGGAGAKLRSKQRALPPMPLGEGNDTSASGHRQRGSGSLASSLSGGLQPRGSARTSIRAESQLSASSTDAGTSFSLDDTPAGGGGGGGGVSSSGEEHGSASVTVTAQASGDASGELLTGDGGFELLRRVPGIRTGRRVSFDASLGRASTDDDAAGGSTGVASESPAASSEPADASADSAAEGVKTPWEGAAAAAGYERPAEAHGAVIRPAISAADAPELPGQQLPEDKPVVRSCEMQRITVDMPQCDL